MDGTAIGVIELRIGVGIFPGGGALADANVAIED